MLIGSFAHYFFGITIFSTSLFLILLVLVQRGRGGGLVGALGGPGGQSALGTKAGDIFTRITIVVATIWIFLCASAVRVLNPSGSSVNLGLDNTAEVSSNGPSGAGSSSSTGASSSTSASPSTTTGAATTGAATGTPAPTTGAPATGDASATPASSTTDKPADKPAEQPAEKPAEKPAESAAAPEAAKPATENPAPAETPATPKSE